MPSIIGLIEKKKRGGAFSAEDIDEFVRVATLGDKRDDPLLAALLMAIYFRGMTQEETALLTLRMAASGEVADLSAIDGVCVDKHSTGGVGDTTTLVLVPLVAACGGKVAKMSGRGLGHTGGTVDKLESIPGMRTELPMEEFVRQVQRIGCAVIGQSKGFVSADKTLYALRDMVATVDSQPLIVSSIMSKKIAAGSGAIVLDVKTGSGALVQTLEDSISLAEEMVAVGALAKRPTLALVTGMDQPLGTHIGNALEVKEAIDVLAGRAGGRLLEVSLQLGAMMLVAGGYAKTEEEARDRMKAALESGQGLAKLREMIEAQGGDGRVVDDVDLLPHTRRVTPVPALKGGYITYMDTMDLGLASQLLGAGRVHKDDAIDPAVGVVMAVSLGGAVRAGDPLAYVHSDDEAAAARAAERIEDAIAISDAPPDALPPLVYAIVRPDGVERFA